MSRSAVLLSGGLDSAVLLAAELHDGHEVWPVHVHAGLAWEAAETRAIERLLRVPPFEGRVRGVTVLAVDMRDVYPAGHWAVAGRPPAYDQPDEDVYLEGRNITLTAKAGILAARLGIDRIVLGPLAGNPFPDATPDFFDAMSRALSLGLDRSICIAAPLAQLHKEDVVKMGMTLGVPLALTRSCMSPLPDEHCGACNKCRERREAFHQAGVADPTTYRRL